MGGRRPARRATATLAGALAACFVLATTYPASAQSAASSPVAGSRPNFAFGHPGGEAGLLAFTGLSNFIYLLPQRKMIWAPFKARPYDAEQAKWSDLFGAIGGSLVQVGLGFAFESGYLALVGDDLPGPSAFHEIAVEAESLFLTSGIDALIKRVTGRCRPRAYHGLDKPCPEADAFPSGHTSAIAAFAGARIVRLGYAALNDGFALRASSLAVAELGMTITGILRILSGSHSWDDVLVGAVIGHATGITVALLHPNVTLVDGAPRIDEAPSSRPAATTTPAPVLFSWGGSF